MQSFVTRDIVAVAASLLYVGAAIGASELIRKRRGYGDEFTRKIVHITVGVWIIPTLLLFTKWHWAALLPAVAIVGNSLSLRYNLLRGIERGVKTDFGTVLFPISFVICLALFFPSRHPEAAGVGIIIMALGDAAAAIFGKAYGRHKYSFLGAKKSFEGSAAMFVVSAAAAFVTMLVFGVSAPLAATVAVCCAAVGTVLEAAGRWGLDNFTVPVACAALAYALLNALGGSAA